MGSGVVSTHGGCPVTGSSVGDIQAGGINAEHVSIQSAGNKACEVDCTTTSNIIYMGVAAIGSATSAAVWQIHRINTTGGNVSVDYADGNENFDNIWDNRASLTYA